MAKTLLVLGNGFDLDLGLKTSYADFINSDFLVGCENNSLINEIKEKYKEANWIDIELFLRDYAFKHQDGGEEHQSGDEEHQSGDEEQIREEFDELRERLNFYMHSGKFLIYNRDVSGVYHYDKDSTAAKVLLHVLSKDNATNIYTFNYTDMTDVIESLKRDSNSRFETPSDNQITYVHGKETGNIENGDIRIVLGFDDTPEIKGFSFMKKPFNKHYKAGITNALKEAEYIIFFGLGYGICDSPYFKKFFSNMQTNSSKKIFVFDKKDENAVCEQWMNVYKITPFLLKENGILHFYNTDKYDASERFANEFDSLCK